MHTVSVNLSSSSPIGTESVDVKYRDTQVEQGISSLRTDKSAITSKYGRRDQFSFIFFPLPLWTACYRSKQPFLPLLRFQDGVRDAAMASVWRAATSYISGEPCRVISSGQGRVSRSLARSTLRNIPRRSSVHHKGSARERKGTATPSGRDPDRDYQSGFKYSQENEALSVKITSYALARFP